MGKSLLECTVCSSSFRSRKRYNNHKCKVVSETVHIKLEPPEIKDEVSDQPMQCGDDYPFIKTEPSDFLEISQDYEEFSDGNQQENDPLRLHIKEEYVEPASEAEHMIIGTELQIKDEPISTSETYIDAPNQMVTDNNSRKYSVTAEQTDSSVVETKYNCTLCSNFFTNKSAFSKHFEETHQKFKPYVCNVCGKRFLQKHYVTLHMRVHTGERPYKCTLCPKTYTHKTSFTIHMRIHNGDRPYVCGVCDKRCYDKSGLTSHMRSHTKETPYECEVCHRKFTHSKSLLVHRRNHTGEKPYVCQYCAKAFRHWHKHKIHIRLHTGERPYKCKICGKGFPRNDEVNRHMKSHRGIKSFKCSICGVYCATQASITGHINLHHSNLKDGDEPPEKTLVKNSESGILGTLVPEPRSIYRNITQQSNYVAQMLRASKSDEMVRTNSGTTRVIEITSKDTPVSFPRKKLLPKLPTTMTSHQSTTNETDPGKTLSYQEFMAWQEKMLAKQGLVVKGFPSDNKKSIDAQTNTAQSKSSPLIRKTSLIKTSGINRNIAAPVKSACTFINPNTKPQFLLVSQQGENGSIQKILVPLGSSMTTGTIETSDIQKQTKKDNPLMLLPQSVSPQPLFVLANGSQRMLVVAPQHSSNANKRKSISIKQEYDSRKPNYFLPDMKEELNLPAPPEALLFEAVSVKEEFTCGL